MLGTFDLTVFILSQCFYFINNRHCLCFFVMINARCIFISKQVAKGLHVVLSPNEDGWLYFSGPVGISLFLWTFGGLLHMGGGGISLGGLQYHFLTQLANAGPKSVKVNLTNCHR